MWFLKTQALNEWNAACRQRRKTMYNKKTITTILILSCFFTCLSLSSSGLALANDWPMFHHDIAHTGYVNGTGPTTNQILWNYTTNDDAGSSPCVVNGIVYVGSSDGNVYALNADSGAKVWNCTVVGGIMSSPCVVDGVVYVGAGDSNVYALDASSGTKIWNYTTGEVVLSSPCVADGIVYVGSFDYNVYALNATSGAKIWNYATGYAVFSSPCIVIGIV
jgi:outer membrane protein assembly factor BamB